MAYAPPVIAEELAIEWDSELLKVLYQLVFSLPDRELGGVLVGTRADQSGTGLPVVQAAIPATQGFIPGQAAMFSHHVWAQVHQTMARHYEGLETVGWYVSRPGHGTQPLAGDMANQARWFTRPDQILLVADSRSHRAAIFAWNGRRLVRVSEGPVARRYTRAPRPRFPAAAVTLLCTVGMAVGAMAFLVAQALGG